MDISADRKTILVVDDAPANRLLLKKIFEGNYNVLQAENGQEALETLRRNTDIAALVLDIFMPVMGGFDVMEVMQGDDALSGIPIVIVTAAGDDDNIIKAMDSGAVDVILKPFNPRVVLHRVRNIVDRAAARRLASENRLYTELLRRSEKDDRTGLYNKTGFFRHGEALLAANPNKEYALVRFDIDKFKVYNEVFGYAAGDKLLRDMGEAMSRDSRDCVYGHLEADHFAGLVPKDRLDLDNWLKNHHEFLASHSKGMRLTSSVGIYMITDRGVDISLMCDRALLALKTVKESYADKVAIYDDDMKKTMLAEQQLERDMERGLSRGQFVVYFQPQVNYETGYIIGAEALVRWQHPERGLIPPAEFIPLFEKNGFISKLDEYVWRQTAGYLRSWMDMSVWESPIPVSVNMSRLDIYDEGICEKIRSITEEYGIPVSLLKLEITESAYMDNPDQLIAVVRKLQSMGFTVEMDDFGSGYSSLNTLKDVPVDILKLDTRFLDAGEDAARGGNILSSVIRMAHWLKLPVIAEGVESRAQADYLKSLGCFYLQGYYFGRPMPAEDFERLLAGGRPESFDAYKNVSLEGIAAFWNPSEQTTLIFNSLVGGAAIMEYQNQELEILRANDKFFEQLGTTREEYVSKQRSTLDRFDANYRDAYRAMLEEAAHTGEEAELDVQSLPHRPGEEPFWTHNRVRLLARNGASRLYYLAVENITERKKIEEALRVSQEELKLAMSQMGKVICSFDIADRTLTVPDEYARKHGFSPVLSGLPDKCPEVEAVLPDDLGVFVGFFNDIISGKSYCQATVRVRLGRDDYCWERLDSFTVFDKDDRPSSAIVSIEDVTSQIAREAEDERNRLLMERTGICVFDYDAADNTLHLRSNYKDKGVTNFDVPDYLNFVLTDGHVHPDYRELLHDTIIEALSYPHSGSLEYIADNWNSGQRWSRMYFVSIGDDTGRVSRMVGQIDDIQEEKDQAAFAERMTAALGDASGDFPCNFGLANRVFTLLYEAEDTEKAVEKVLASIGSFYDVSRAYIFEDSPDHLHCSNTFEWCAPGVSPEISNLQSLSYETELPGYRENFDDKGVFFCPDISALPKEQYNVLAPQGIRSMLQCSLVDDGVFSGYIGFDDCHENRQWTAEQAATLTIVARLLCVFQIKWRKSVQAAFSADFRTALDDNSAYIYIVDPEVHVIKYENRTIRNYTGKNGMGKKCYEEYRGLDAPCPNCPMHSGCPSKAVEMLRADGLFVLTQASPLTWNGSDMFVVTSTDVSHFKGKD